VHDALGVRIRFINFVHRHEEGDLRRLDNLQRFLGLRLDAVIGGAQYNFFLHTVPHDGQQGAHAHSYHWHLEICPRTSIPTGFELGSGMFINTALPEESAKFLNSIEI